MPRKIGTGDEGEKKERKGVLEGENRGSFWVGERAEEERLVWRASRGRFSELEEEVSTGSRVVD